MDKEHNESFYEFKKWMSTQNESNPLIGVEVEPKIQFRKILSKIEVQEGDTLKVAKDFKSNGGTIVEVNGETFLIECQSGTFFIHRRYVGRT